MFKGLTNISTGKAYIINNVPATIEDINNLSQTITLFKDELTKTIKDDIYTTRERLEKYNQLLSDSIANNYETQTDLVTKVGNNLHTTITNNITKVKEEYDNRIADIILSLENEVDRLDDIIEKQKKELVNADKHTLEIIERNNSSTLSTIIELRSGFDNLVKELSNVVEKNKNDVNTRIDKEVENIRNGCYGNIYGYDSEIVLDNSEKIMEQFREDGFSNDIVLSASNDSVTFIRDGKYSVNYSSIISGEGELEMLWYIDKELQKHLSISQKINGQKNINTCGIVEIVNKNILKIMCKGVGKIKVEKCSLVLNKIG